ncbi:MAG: hypothetical protein PHS24_04600 [Bacilli bacterium]|nr:hypothetical protein [Bacilli bacterium]
MEQDLQFKIYRDKKLANYLKEYSQWYKYLNRSTDNFKLFLNDYKKYSRNQNVGKFNNAIDTLDTVNSIFKIIN